MTQLIFHLGDRKTGSTSIQTTLASGSVHCAGKTLLYPGQGQVNHIPLAKTLTDDGMANLRKPRFRAVVDEIAEKQPDVTIISAERFESVDPALLKRTMMLHMPDYVGTAKFIAYVRPHADRIVSEYAEQVKQGHAFGSLEQMHQRTLSRDRFQYTPRFQAWRDTFGDQFTLRPMIRDRLKDRDVVADFLDFALGGAGFEIRGTPAANESLTLEDLVLLRHLQMRLGERRNGELQSGKASTLQISTGWELARRLSRQPAASSTKLRLHASLADAVVTEYLADAKALDAAFFDGTPMEDELRAAPGRAVEVAQSMDLADHYGAESVRLIDVLVGQIEHMLKADPTIWPKLFRDSHHLAVTQEEKPARKGGGKKPGGRMGAGKPGGGKKLGGGAGRRRGLQPKAGLLTEQGSGDPNAVE